MDNKQELIRLLEIESNKRYAYSRKLLKEGKDRSHILCVVQALNAAIDILGTYETESIFPKEEREK